jgi:hypothetical protein
MAGSVPLRIDSSGHRKSERWGFVVLAAGRCGPEEFGAPAPAAGLTLVAVVPSFFGDAVGPVLAAGTPAGRIIEIRSPQRSSRCGSGGTKSPVG